MSGEFEIKRKVLVKYTGKSKTPEIPFGVKKIAEGAFENADIDTAKIPESVTEISKYAFAGSQIKEIIIPKAVEKIGTGAFSLCENLRSVTVLGHPNNDGKKIDWIFCICKRLAEINLPDDMPRATGIYSGAGKIKRVELLPTETEVKDLAFNSCWSLKEVVIPKGVTKIGYGAFAECESLQKIVLPEGVTEIGEKAFKGCSRLKTVVIPKSVKTVASDSFADCYNLGARTLSKIEKIENVIPVYDDWD